MAPLGIQTLRKALPRLLVEADNGLSSRFRQLLAGLAEDLRYLDTRILGISKQGHAYPRTQLIHGARLAVYAAKGKTDPLSCWISALQKRRHTNVVVVALANKTARMAWALLRHDRDNDARWSIAAVQTQ